jgi:hypothetical protein
MTRAPDSCTAQQTAGMPAMYCILLYCIVSKISPSMYLVAQFIGIPAQCSKWFWDPHGRILNALKQSRLRNDGKNMLIASV